MYLFFYYHILYIYNYVCVVFFNQNNKKKNEIYIICSPFFFSLSTIRGKETNNITKLYQLVFNIIISI